MQKNTKTTGLFITICLMVANTFAHDFNSTYALQHGEQVLTQKHIEALKDAFCRDLKGQRNLNGGYFHSEFLKLKSVKETSASGRFVKAFNAELRAITGKPENKENHIIRRNSINRFFETFFGAKKQDSHIEIEDFFAKAVAAKDRDSNNPGFYFKNFGFSITCALTAIPQTGKGECISKNIQLLGSNGKNLQLCPL